MLRTGLGLTGARGIEGGRTTETLTGLADLSDTRSSSLTLVENCLPTASAIRAASLGLPSSTVTSISTVSRGTLAATFLPRLSAVVWRPSCWITGSSTVGLVMMSE